MKKINRKDACEPSVSRREFLKTAALAGGMVVMGPFVSGDGYGKMMKAGAPSAGHVRQTAFRYSDAHCHFVDFVQRTDGITALLENMNAASVEHIQIMGMPVVKKWQSDEPREPHYYLDDDSRTYWYSATDEIVARAVISLPEQDRQRFHPFICGFNGTNRNAVDHVQRMIAWYPDFWEGIGEIFTRHDDLTALTYGETPRADNRALDPIYALAAQHDLPVQMHSNIGNKRLREPVYMHEMESALRRHRSTRFIWAHVGISREFTIPSIIEDARRLLAVHRNLWFDLSWVVYDEHVAPGGKLDSRWLGLVKEFPDRFMIGTDNIGHFETYAKDIRKYDLLLDALDPQTARLVAYGNFITVLPKRVRKRQCGALTYGMGKTARA